MSLRADLRKLSASTQLEAVTLPGSPKLRKRPSKCTSLRLVALINLCVGLFLCLGILAFHFRISRLEQPETGDIRGLPSAWQNLPVVHWLAQEGTRKFLQGKQELVHTGKQQLVLLQSPAVDLDRGGALLARTIMPLTARYYHGPLDVDDAAHQRAFELNTSYWSRPGAKNWWEKPGFHFHAIEEDPPYPFQRMKDEAGKDTGIIALIAPFYNMNYYKAESARALFWQLKANGHIMIGISSYQEFPRQTSNPYDDRHTIPSDWELYKHMDGWLHCFRNPDAMIPEGVPRILLSESDFQNCDRRDEGGSLVPEGLPKQYDFFYNNQGGEWNDYSRNWTLAKSCMLHAYKEMNASFIITGRDTTKETDPELADMIAAGKLTIKKFMPWNEMLKVMESSRFLMAPNIYDGSPRVVTEAMCLNVPILVNRNIMGGWKYVHEQTGEYFETPEEFLAAAQLLSSPQRKAVLRPREWYKETYGYERASMWFQAFMEIVVGPERIALARSIPEARKITWR